MNKKGTVYIAIIMLTLGALLLLEYNKPKEINWFPSYVAHHKIPYGTKVLNDLMAQKFTTVQLDRPPYEQLQQDSTITGTYFFVNSDISLGETELHALLRWTATGNTLFMAAEHPDLGLLDTLNLDTSFLYAGLGDDDLQRHQLVNPRLQPRQEYIFDQGGHASYFKELDTLNATILGTVDIRTTEDTPSDARTCNVVQYSFGHGKIILSTFPQAFTNYFILKDENHRYTAGLLSYLDTDRTLYMDNYHKAGKSFYTSPMYLFLNTKEFKWAYYMVLIGALMYVLFEGKRKQRAIPVVKPLKNQTLAFTRTIGNMYYTGREQKQISSHKIDAFFDYIRTKFHCNPNNKRKDFYQSLASRSHHTIEEVKQLFQYIEDLSSSAEVTDDQLITLNKRIEKFKHKAHGKQRSTQQ